MPAGDRDREARGISAWFWEVPSSFLCFFRGLAFRVCAAAESESVPLAVPSASFWEGVSLRDGFPPPIVPSLPMRFGFGFGLGDGAAEGEGESRFALSSSLSGEARLRLSSLCSLRFLPPTWPRLPMRDLCGFFPVVWTSDSLSSSVLSGSFRLLGMRGFSSSSLSDAVGTSVGRATSSGGLSD